MRRGKWTSEESAFAARLIQDFESGMTPNVEEGQTLRAYLSRILCCSPMRVSKKFAGQFIGKQVNIYELTFFTSPSSFYVSDIHVFQYTQYTRFSYIYKGLRSREQQGQGRDRPGEACVWSTVEP
jgi:hypothetical protein